jgi:Protein of unknown function (DUF2911)
MKITTLLLLVFLFSTETQAQLHIPTLSPTAVVQQQIGLGRAIITYGRPSLRGRKLLGTDNVPNGKVWRMGANEVTTLELSEDMVLEGKPLAKGKYALVAIPDVNEWTIVINSVSNQWGVYQYKESKDVMRFKVKTEKIESNVETLTFVFEDIYPSSAALVFSWENTQLKIVISQDNDARVMAEIKEKTSKENPNLSVLMEAAEYYLMMNRDLEQALVWSEKVLEKQKSPFRYNLKAQIAQKLGKCDLATEAAKGAIEYAEKSGDVAAKTLAQDIIKVCKK